MSSSGNSVGLSGGPLRKDRAFLYLGYDQHQLTVPSIMQFGNGASSVVPQAADYDRKDKDLVFAAAAQLNGMAGEYLTQMGGNAGFAKLDLNLSSRHLLFFRLSPSRYSGSNNVFFDPASPITTYAETSNGIEDVKTESLAPSWTSTWTNRLATNLRAQFSRNEQQSFADSDDPKIKIYNLVDGIGRSNILPRETSEHKLHIADTVSYNNGRMNWKFGGDFLQGWIYNYYPAMFGGEFYFDNVKVNPWFFTPMKYGDPLTPLRADAHGVPRYYMQDFGTAVSHPNSRSYALFAQNGIRVTRSLTVNAGLRYDLQTFEAPGLVSNPLYAPSGQIPTDTTNFSPRVGFTYAIRERHPIVLRGGFGRFYSLIPAMYASKVENGTGMTQTQLFLDIMKPADAAIFPNYPNALANCPSGATTCATPASVASHLTTQVSAFSPNFQTPYTEQASLTLEFGIGANPTASASYLYVHGERLIRSLDANLPKPKVTEYPVYDEQSVFTGDYYSVASFATWQTKRTRWTAPIGPGYFTVDVRLSKGFQLGERVRLTLLAESFNVSNRVNQRVDISDDGFLNSAGQFIAYSTKAGKTLYPGEFVKNSKFLIPTNSYAPRQVQFPIKASF